MIAKQVLTTDCYDNDPMYPWEFRFGQKRRPLTQPMRDLRCSWSDRLLAEGMSDAWYLRNVVWIDLCSKIIPGTPEKAYDMMLAGKNKRKRLMSSDAVNEAENQGGSKTAEKQCRIYVVLHLSLALVMDGVSHVVCVSHVYAYVLRGACPATAALPPRFLFSNAPHHLSAIHLCTNHFQLG